VRRKTTAELRPGERVKYRGLAGLVLPYGWHRNGEWRHGLLAPVLCLDGITRMLRPEDVQPLEKA
jgi:hypothetical protein